MKDVMDKYAQSGSMKAKGKRAKDLVTRDLISALGLCHNVTPTIDDDGLRTFQASSPDEIALVQISE